MSTEDAVQDWETTPDLPAADEQAAPEAPDAEAAAETPMGEETETQEEAKPDQDNDIAAKLKEIEETKKAIAREAYEVRKLKQKLKDKEGATPAEIELSDAQFEALLAEHGDDKRMQVQIMKQMAKQIAKGEKVDAVKTVEMQQLKREQDHFLATNFPDISKEDSELRASVDRAKAMLGIDDSPYADWFAMASIQMVQMPQIIKAAEERGRQAALKGKTEDARKAAIKGNQGTKPASALPSGTPDAANNYGLTPQQMETAKNVFKFKTPEQLKWYAQNLKTANAR